MVKSTETSGNMPAEEVCDFGYVPEESYQSSEVQKTDRVLKTLRIQDDTDNNQGKKFDKHFLKIIHI